MDKMLAQFDRLLCIFLASPCGYGIGTCVVCLFGTRLYMQAVYDNATDNVEGRGSDRILHTKFVSVT